MITPCRRLLMMPFGKREILILADQERKLSEKFCTRP
jgi:hypothetical protein